MCQQKDIQLILYEQNSEDPFVKENYQDLSFFFSEDFCLFLSLQKRQYQFTDVDTCIVLQGGYGERLDCPSGYVGTGACGSGKHYSCGRKTANRLLCCKTTVPSKPLSCNSNSTAEWGENLMCPSGQDGRIKLVTQYCGSGKNRECHNERVSQIQCCEITNLITSDMSTSCSWIWGDYGEFIQCEAGHAMAGACGSKQGQECQEKFGHGIYCCKVE